MSTPLSNGRGMSGFFVRRPIFSAVISIVIVIAGLMSARILPIAQNPDLAPPTVTITANYPGASAETLAKTVAAPIEEQLSGIDGMMYFSSNSSSNGAITITATFNVGTDADLAAVQVQNRVKAAEPRLPEEVRRNGVLIAKSTNDLVLVVGLRSPDASLDTVYVSNYALINILDELKRIPGVGEARVFGSRDYAMRVWFEPDRLAQLGLTPADLAGAINRQNAQYAAGKIGQEPAPTGQKWVYTVTAKGRLGTAEEFGDIVVRADGAGGALRLKDVATVEQDAQNYDITGLVDGKPGVGIGIFLLPGANALDVGDAVKAKMVELRGKFPAGLDYAIPYDTTRFINASIREVLHTLGEAGILVVLVVFLFLQSWRTTLIPVAAVPVSIIGSLAGLYVLGFSINTMTLFGMVLAIGIVVDDAIVVLENVERLMREKKMSPVAAAVETMREVSGALVAMVLVLCATFVPVAFLGGIAGKLYQQFAATITISVVISGIVALTLTPALCGVLLKPHEGEATLFGIRFFHPFNWFFEKLTNAYVGTVAWLLRFWPVGLALFVAMAAGTGYLFHRTPSSFVPNEDQGYFISILKLPEGASLQRTEKSGRKVLDQVAQIAEIDHSFLMIGMDFTAGGAKTNGATMFTPLKDWDERKAPEQQLGPLMGRLAGAAGAAVDDGVFFSFPPPPIRGLGRTGGFELYLQSRAGDDPQALASAMDTLMAALRADPNLNPAALRSNLSVDTPQLRVEVDDAKAVAMGLDIGEVYAALQTAMGSAYINDFNLSGRTFRVMLQAKSAARADARDLGRLQVRTQDGAMVPLSTVVSVKEIAGADQLARFNGFLSVQINGEPAVGVSSGAALQAVEDVAAKVLPPGFDLAWTGSALEEKKSGQSSSVAFIFAVVMVFLILAAQYERWSLPLAVILAVPFALFGAVIAVLWRGMPNDIYFQIGLVTLIALAAKNGILIVEFAQHKRDEGMDATQAALEALRLRFRPIMMTSLTFVLGVTPLVIASGAGSAARRSLGTGVFGGMLAATFIATLFIPLFFRLLSWDKPGSAEHPLGTEVEETK